MLNYLTKHKYNLLFVLLGVLLFVAAQLFGYDGLLGQDSYEYFRYSGRIKNYLLNGEYPGDFIWPIVYPLSVALIDLVVNKLIVSAQLISLLSYIGCNIVLFNFVKLLYPKANQFFSFLFVFIFLGFSPYFLRFGLTSMSDLLCAFFVLNTFYYLINYKETQREINLFLVVVFSLLALTTRNSAVVLIVIPLCISAFYLLKKRNINLIALSFLISTLLLLPTFLANKSQLTGNGMSTSSFSFLNLFTTQTIGSDGVFNYSVPNIVYSGYGFFHPAFIFLGIFFIAILVIKRININKLILFSTLVFSVFIGTYYFQNKRFFIIQFPLILLLFYPAYDYIIGLIKSSKIKISLILVCFLVNVFLSAFTFNKAHQIQQNDVQLAMKIKPFEGNVLYVFEVDAALKARGIIFTYKNLWEEEYKGFEKGSLVLFNEPRFKEQWQGQTVMINWNNLTENHTLIEIKDIGQGWLLYEIN